MGHQEQAQEEKKQPQDGDAAQKEEEQPQKEETLPKGVEKQTPTQKEGKLPQEDEEQPHMEEKQPKMEATQPQVEGTQLQLGGKQSQQEGEELKGAVELQESSQQLIIEEPPTKKVKKQDKKKEGKKKARRKENAEKVENEEIEKKGEEEENEDKQDKGEKEKDKKRKKDKIAKEDKKEKKEKIEKKEGKVEKEKVDQKEKKEKKGKKGKSPNIITSRMVPLEFKSTIMVITPSQSQAVRSQGTLGYKKSESAGVIGSQSSKALKRKKSTSKSRSKRNFKSISHVTQDDEYSYSTASTASDEEKSAVKQVRTKRRKSGKNKTVKLTGIETEEGGGGEGELELVEEAVMEKAEKKGKKRKKGNKGKKEKKEKSVVEEEEEDIMAQIMKLKEVATTETESEAATEGDKKSKKKKKKKGSKKKKGKKMTPQMMEQLKIEAEQEAMRQAELEKIRLTEERLAAMEQEKKEIVEAQVREEQLSKTFANIERAFAEYTNATKAEREEEEWKLFVECGKLPNPYFCNEMNTYLHIWEQEIDTTTVSDASTRTADMLKLIDDLEELISTSPEAVEDEGKMENWLWIRQLFRDYQQTSLDVATYRLLRNVFKNLVRLDIPTADYNFKDFFVTLCIWLRVQLPKPLPNPRRPPKPRIDVTFITLDNLQVTLPLTIDLEKMALRAMYLKYDHLSDTCEFFYCPPVPPHYNLDLKEACKNEMRTRLKYKYDHRDKKPIPVIDPDVSEAKIFIPEPEDFASDEEIPIVPWKKLEPTSSEYALILEEQLYNEAHANFTLEMPGNVINLRKYAILGGIYYINLLHQPPQPQDYVILDLNITRLFVPKILEHVDLYISYLPPPPSDPDVRKAPEELEEEMKRNEEALDSLIYFNLTWPKHVIFLDLPSVCVWDDKEKYWTNRNIRDLKHNEEKGTLSFKSQIFGIFGLATLRYSNLPYQAWEVKPEEDGSVNISITSAILIFEFNVKDGKICLVWVQNSPNNALKPYVGRYMKLYTLKKIFKETGINIFPEHDAFCYVEGSCEKHWPTEKNLYGNIAALSGTFNFAWSRWNLSLPRRTIVLLMRELSFDKSKQKTYSTLLVTPLKATIINCTEVSQEFSDEPTEATKFCADLFNLMKAVSGITVRKKVEEFSKLNVYTVSEFLIATRVLSFS